MNLIYDGVKYDVLVDRRRYGNITYTWVYGFQAQDGICYGPIDGRMDPFPCVVPAKKELTQLLVEWKTNGVKWKYEGFKVIYI